MEIDDMTESDDSTGTIYEPPIEVNKPVVTDYSDDEPVQLAQASVQVIEAANVKMHQSAAFSVLADDVDMRESVGFVIRADEVRIENSVTFILAGGEIKGNVTTLFTPVTAMILGGAIMIGMLLLRPGGRRR